MEIAPHRGTRHAKITGDFAEHLVLYWLSKHGFECARVDHTGIDLIASKGSKFIGISVKSRSRFGKDESDSVSIPKENFKKAKVACLAFHCTPYFAIVVDNGVDKFRVYLMSMETLLRISPLKKSGVNWNMRQNFLTKYLGDKEVSYFEMSYQTIRW
ncbi:MAG: hypothetical protein A2W52_02190 [Candidatus Taylorbacteria bacterium RIFCSPHIGHO2_02_49_25]|uniref:Holliday junction resolvase n=1 Tax=Candidatus Taylorbacteria bacterium RIFCSPHIGHO2_02_49_25 TaxID=1802305 RepID=A0A1G2MCW2_9BACT|nr:MAG: hypothetical protein UY62_C0021G0013 [Parcubacteria group bacterium GW2011_GWF2_50_9]OHA19928.1 MAG: hypothetical protein A2759_04095 [Candidatus Taylorbacteria bacterium RIFCSPHIGHO2_01_FULL_49_60]OHA21750.1 MAG: hypothetical protein A2W52_02190 [Candidatus Taylorbacteria bacterium RIFCSPHIGHO2_02_49_25]OHA35448.1 MAG: hypothetical protein A2W65_00305 [Candidatus Taylorbacteria bacterium RIFCSPLOWO2_02_50_13]OHA36187.1 MAG: hypothetical protein A3B27_03255 [Candidatus Taylorbacteria ba